MPFPTLSGPSIRWVTDPETTRSGEQPWLDLAPHYERARAKEDSLDRLVEWPAQREMLGDVSGLAILDLGCGNGAKLAELVADGATDCVGVDVSGQFIAGRPNGLTLVQGDVNALENLEFVRGRQFDRILFLQSFGYATDAVATLRQAVRLLAEDGSILLTRTHPVRYAVERAERNGTSLGEEYYARGSWSGDSRWDSGISLTKQTYTIADLLNVFAQAGLWIEEAAEPEFPEAARHQFPHKAAWMDKHLGILIFRLRPVPVR